MLSDQVQTSTFYQIEQAKTIVTLGVPPIISRARAAALLGYCRTLPLHRQSATIRLTAMVVYIQIGARVFSLVSQGAVTSCGSRVVWLPPRRSAGLSHLRQRFTLLGGALPRFLWNHTHHLEQVAQQWPTIALAWHSSAVVVDSDGLRVNALPLEKLDMLDGSA